MMLWPFTETVAFRGHPQPVGRVLHPGGSSGGSGGGRRRPAPMALGSDGAKLDPYPVHLVGCSDQAAARPVPLALHDDAWCGMSVNGPIARTVEDAALFLDVTASS